LRLLEQKWDTINEAIVEVENKNKTLNIYREHKRVMDINLFDTAEAAISDLHNKIVNINTQINSIFIDNSDLFVVSVEFVQSEISEFVDGSIFVDNAHSLPSIVKNFRLRYENMCRLLEKLDLEMQGVDHRNIQYVNQSVSYLD
jgi:hypothetical protein